LLQYRDSLISKRFNRG